MVPTLQSLQNSTTESQSSEPFRSPKASYLQSPPPAQTMAQEPLQGITINSYIQYQQQQLANKALENVEEGRLKTKNSGVDRTLSNSPPHKIGRMHSKYDRANYENAKNLKTGFKNATEEIRPRFVPKMKINGERIVAKRPPLVHNQVYAEVNELLDLTASPQSPSSYEAM